MTFITTQSMFEPGEPPPNLIRMKHYKPKNPEICGYWTHTFSPATGKGQSVHYCCNRNDCEGCRKRRGKLLKKGMMEAIQNNKDIRLYFFTQKDATNFIRGLHKSDFQRLPCEEYDMLFVDIDKVKKSSRELFQERSLLSQSDEQIDAEWIEWVDWSEMLMTPEGRKRSGSLGWPKAKGKTEKFAMIQRDLIYTDAEHRKVLELMKRVIKETSHLQPHSAKEVEGALRVRTAALMKKLLDAGHTVEMYIHRTKVVLAHINWTSDLTLSTYMDSINAKNDIGSRVPVANQPPMKQKPMPI